VKKHISQVLRQLSSSSAYKAKMAVLVNKSLHVAHDCELAPADRRQPRGYVCYSTYPHVFVRLSVVIVTCPGVQRSTSTETRWPRKRRRRPSWNARPPAEHCVGVTQRVLKVTSTMRSSWEAEDEHNTAVLAETERRAGNGINK